jgi:hypothetical protein
LLSPDQITAIAPDASSLKAGRDIGTLRKWEMAGGDSEVLWGLAMGSGKNPYQTLVSLADLASKCSCPSRKFPCKHALGLMFLAAATPFAASDRPQWATEWLESRTARAEKSKAATETKAAKPVDEKAAEKRRAQRENRVSEGASLLRQTLLDLAREGLASGHARNPGFWADLAKRMVDCQAPGLAGALRHIGDTVLRDPDVDTELPFELGRLHLLLHALDNPQSHDPATLAELNSQVGGRNDAIGQTETVEDEWFVAARRISERDRLLTSTTWLLGENSRRWAKLLRFAPAHQTIAEPWPFGSSVRAVMKFEPGLHPLRAAPETETLPKPAHLAESHESGLGQLLDRYAAALSENPFLRNLPFLIPLHPAQRAGYLIDPAGQALPFATDADTALRIDCICGGQPTPICGEWDGRKLRPLAIRDGDTWFPLTRLQP